MPQHLSPKVINWASILDEQTEEQAIMTASMPFVEPHLALMPDAHLGKGATVGSVIPTVGAIIPAAVGVDIGCGMDAVLTQWTVADIEALVEAGQQLSDLRKRIEQSIPLSAGNYNKTLDNYALKEIDGLAALAETINLDVDQIAGNWKLQLGTLGSGNHFIEISKDEQDRIWVFLHSGSRGVGNRIAQHHIKVAQDYCKRNFIGLPHQDLAYLVEGTKEFGAYMDGLFWAQEFARRNRKVMMGRVLDALGFFMSERAEEREWISCHHNYTSRENHFGRNVLLSRKGAIDASAGKLGLIPGSMGDKSYVVRGLGNPLSLNSAPHGAGRNYSRTKARRIFTQDDLRERMAGIEYKDSAEFVDEHPLAYKPIDQVMEDASDLVEIVHTLQQLVNVKGD